MRSSYVDSVLREWKEESKVTHLMLYKIVNGVLTIYTDRPGPLIGFHGERVARFSEKLKRLSYPKVTDIRIETTDGIF